MRRLWLILAGVSLTCVLAMAETKAFVPPNIIIIMADDMGFDDISFRGSREFLTPNIDALAYHGKILNRLYVPPLCTPSRATLLTGLYPIRTGSQHFVLFNEEPWGILENHTTMAQIFQAHGYSTNLVGKWHLGLGSRNFTPTYKGFDYHYGYWGGYIDYYRRRSKMPSTFSLGYDFRRNLDIECPTHNTYATDLFTSEAEDIIFKNNGSKPLFLMVSHLAPHSANLQHPLQAPSEEIAKFSYIPNKRRRIYAAMLSKLDESVGRIIRALDKSLMLENSIVLFYSDNGGSSANEYNNTASNWPLRGQKHSPWEGGVRVAGAIWSPLLHNLGSVFEKVLYVGDWFPTLLAAARLDLDLQLDGLNLWRDLMEDSANSPSHKNKDREVLHVLDDILAVTSYMKGEFKYINGSTDQGKYDKVLRQRPPNVIDPRNENYEETIKNSLTSKSLQKYDLIPLTKEKIQNLRLQAQLQCGDYQGPLCDPIREECLFNMQLDPCEQNNLAAKPENAKLLQDMRERLEELRSFAVPPKTGGSNLAYDPSHYDCAWTNYLEETPRDYTLECDYNSPPCH